MTGEETALAVVEALTGLGIPFMVVGYFSTNYYGIPGPDEDPDLIVEFGPNSVGELTRGLAPGLRLDPRKPFESSPDIIRHEVRVADGPFKINLFQLSRDPHDEERFRRRQKVTLLGRQAWLPTAEDVVIAKLRWALLGARSKDRDDARDVIAEQGDRIDWDYVHAWCERHGTRALLDEVRRSIPPI